MIPERIPLLLVSALTLLGSGCRALNPGFGEMQGQAGTPAPDAATSSAPEASGAFTPSIEASSTQSTSSEVSPGSSTTLPPIAQTSSSSGTASTPEQTSSSGSSTTDSSTATNSKSSSGTSSGNNQRWGPEGPPESSSAGPEDHCLKGSTTCFILSQHADAKIPSGTPGHTDITLAIQEMLIPDSNHPSTKSPTNLGLSFDGVKSRMQSTGDFPVYAGQDFGIELWYRSAPNHTIQRNMMLFQVHRNIWLEEFQDGGVSCTLPNLDTGHTAIQHSFQPERDGGSRDLLRYVVCFVYQGHVYLFSNGVMHKKGPSTPVDSNAGAANPTFGVGSDQLSGAISLGSVADNDPGAANFSRFKGTIYMARTWNNIAKLKKAVVAELEHHGLSTQGLSNLNL